MADPAFPLTIDDTSPLVLYQPFGDIFTPPPDLAAGWNQYYSISGFASSPSGSGSESSIESTIGNGTSLHLTASDGAALQYTWNGTDITIFGTLTQAFSTATPDVTYSVVLDGTATTNFISHLSPNAVVDTAATDILASFQGLPEGSHSIQLTLHNPSQNSGSANVTDGPILAFDRMLVQMGAGKQSSSPTADGTPTPSATASTSPVPDDAIAYRGQWNFTPGLLPGSTASFHTSNKVGDRATLVFNGSAVGLTGLTTPESGAYNVSLDSEGPITLSSRASFTASAPTLLFFRTGLDPDVMHTLEVVNAGPAGAGDNAGSLLVLAAVNVTTVESAAPTPAGASSSGLSKGAVAALAIGITLGVALVAVAAVLCVRRRRRIARRKRELLVNPRINRAGRLSFLFPGKRLSHAGEKEIEHGRERSEGQGPGVLDIRSPNPDAPEKQDESDDDEDGTGEGVSEGGEGDARRFSAAEKGKARALRRSNASKNSDGSYSIDLPDLTIAQVPRGYLPTSMVPSTPSPPKTFASSLPSPTSPRSPKPRGPREMQGRDSTRGILLTNLGPASPGEDEEDALGLGAPSYLPDAHISPLRVEFASELPERPDRRTERAISTGTAVSLPQSLQQALAEQRTSRTQAQVPVPELPVPSPTRPEPVFSFLDFNNSSTSTSLSRAQRQSASDSTGKSAGSSSKRNTGSEHSTQSPSVNWASLPPDRRISLGLSMTVSGGPTASRPSLSPSVLLQPVPLPPPVPPLPTISTDQATLSSTSSGEPEGPDQPFPYDAAAGGPLPSPTDSIPFTVSDIHFRHSTHSSFSGHPESRRASAQRLSGSHRPPHPPLPGIASGQTSPTPGRMAHQRQGSTGGSQTVPPFIVQRILGRTPSSNPGSPFGSPVTQQFASMSSAMGRASVPAGGSTSPTPASPPASSPPPGGRGSGSGQAQTTTGSGPTVFGFQLGRHR